MSTHEHDSEHGCGCCDCSRRDFLAIAGVATGLATLGTLSASAAEAVAPNSATRKEPARIRVAVIYTP